VTGTHSLNRSPTVRRKAALLFEPFLQQGDRNNSRK
jgi:hypothetical protein